RLWPVQQQCGAALGCQHGAAAMAVAGIEHGAVDRRASVPFALSPDLSHPLHGNSIPPGSWGCTDNFTVCWRGVDRLSLAGRNTPPRSPGRFMIKLLCHAAAIILTSSLLLAPARAQDMTGTWLTGQG